MHFCAPLALKMEQQKIREALSLDIFLKSLLHLGDSADESDEDDANDAFFLQSGNVPVLQRPTCFIDLEEPRQWIKTVLEDSSSDSNDDESIEDLLKVHQLSKQYREQYQADPTLAKYMYYSSDALTGQNKWPLHVETIKKKGGKRKAQINKQLKSKRPRVSTSPYTEGSGASFTNRSTFRGKTHTLNDKITHGNMVKKKALSLSRKKTMSMAALRRYIWKLIAKKEIPKAHRQHVQNQTNKFALLKKASKDASKKIRAKAVESRLRAKKEIQIARARRMTREAQVFWKKYIRVEKTQRKHAEKQALTQRRIEDEMREAYKQEQKLRFLITQTELYAHFVSGKTPDKAPLETEQKQSEQNKEAEPKATTASKPQWEEPELSHEKAYENANNAFLLHQSKLKMYQNAEEIFKSKDDNIHRDSSQPRMICGQLTGYQLTGVNWLFNLYRHGLNGILADDMGLGKTVQTIAFFAGLAERYNVWGPFLVVAPASTLNNWHQEFSRFLPEFKILPYWGTTSERKILRLFWNQQKESKNSSETAFHVLITSYQLATTDMKYFQKIPWHYIVFDEAHALKSSNSIRWRTLLDFKCRNRLLLTGTPVQNTMAELWALLHFIMPTLFDNHAEFNDWFAKNIESYADSKSSIDESDLARLHRILKPFILRRLKSDVEHELTEKIEVRVLCHLSPRQRVLYDALQKNILIKELIRAQSYSGQSTNNIVLMNLVMQFRKVCNHPDIFNSREILSPFWFKTNPFIFPRLLHNSFFTSTSSQRNSIKLFYSDLNVHMPSSVERSMQNVRCGKPSPFSFLRLINVSSMEYWKLFSGNLSNWLQFFEAVENHKRKRVHCKLYQQTQSPCYISTFSSNRAGDDTKNWALSPISLYLINPQDFCHYFSSSESLLNDFFFVAYSKMAYGFLTHTVTCLKSRSDVIECSINDGVTVSPKKNVLSSPNYHRAVATVRYNVLTDLSSSFLNLYTPKVCCPMREVYCDDVGALRHFKHIESCVGTSLSGWNFPYSSPICVPDRELLVSDSGKLLALDMLLRRLKDGGHRVLVYSQMTKMIDILEEYMLMRGHSYVRLDGSCRISSRRDTVAGFQTSDDIFVFLLSTRAGGLGINLTAADTVIFYDSDWNPTVDQQAMDRAHRLGQTKQVTVYRLVCKGTVDERILARAEAKSAIQRMVIQDGSFKNDPLNQTEMVNLLLDDDHIAKASQSDDVLKRSLEKAKRTEKRKYRRKSKQEGKIRKKRARNRRKSAESETSTKKEHSVMNISTDVTKLTNTCGSSSNDEQLVVDDNPPVSIATPPLVTRGQKKRGRPRLRPLPSNARPRMLDRSPQRRWRGGSRRGRGGRRGRSFSGRAAAMAGARAGAMAATMYAQGASTSSFPS